MNTKLTLTIEGSIIERAKKYAKDKERSLSDLVENYLKTLSKNDVQDEIEITPIVKNLKGSFNVPDDFGYKSELSKRLSEKYL